MAYLELYKKYRPKVWEELIGQEKVAKGFKKAVAEGRIPVAYSIVGPRGTGKTSAALLLAKSINCENPQHGNPCNACDVCVAIDNDAQPGVEYLSMANHGGVEAIRKIANDSRLATSINQRVWILDEVHNMSPAAQDALLIPLEDKSQPALFILCSTDGNKIKDTIYSRVQRRKMNLVDAATMSDYLKVIGKKENIDLTDDVVAEAVRLGKGSVRDTLSALDGLISVEDEDEPAVMVDKDLLEALGEKDFTKMMAVVAEAMKQGYESGDIANTLVSDLRNVLLFNADVDPELVGIVPVEDPAALGKKLYGEEGIVRVINEIGNGISTMTYVADSRVALEVSLANAVTSLRRTRMELARRKAKKAAAEGK